MKDWKQHADWRLVPSYMKAPIIAYIDDGQPGGEFLEALFSNQFVAACLSADLYSKQRLLDYAKFLSECAPALCQGSPKAYADWLKIGGFNGLQKRAAKLASF